MECILCVADVSMQRASARKVPSPSNKCVRMYVYVCIYVYTHMLANIYIYIIF